MKCSRLLIISSVSLILLAGLSYGCDIFLKPKAIVSGAFVEIGDIAKVSNKQYVHVKIGASPYLNNSIVLSQTYIKSLLRQKEIDASICGAKLVRVERKAVVLSGKKLLTILGLKNGVVLGRKPVMLDFSRGYKFESHLERASGSLKFFRLDVYLDGKLVKSVPVVVKLKSKGLLVPVAKRSIENGSIISSSDITYSKVSRLPPNVLLSKSIIEGRIAISFIKKGQPFTLYNTKRYKPVKMGDLVKVEVVEGNIIISTVAKALRGGYEGDIIPIMYLSSRIVRPAKIIGDKLVEVQ